MALGHQHHFLSRLDRLSLPHTELALSLYNDKGLTSMILHEAKISDETPRVALCLGETASGPHLVVARDGHFVTALAEGMKISDVPVLSRQHLDTIARRLGVLRERMDVSRQRTGRTGHVGNFFEHMRKAGSAYTREDFRAIVGFHPFLRHAFLQGYIGHSETLLDLRRDYEVLRRLKGSARAEVAETAWGSYWSMLHLMVLLGADDGWDLPADYGYLFADTEFTLTWVPARIGHFSAIYRASWMASRLLRNQTGRIIETYRTAKTETYLLATATALLGIAAHHPSACPEILAALLPGEPQSTDEYARVLDATRNLWHAVLEVPSEDLEPIAASAAMVFFEHRKQQFGLPLPYPSEEALPYDARRLALAHLWGDPQSDLKENAILLPLLRLMAQNEPEDFFPPAAERLRYCTSHGDDALDVIFQRRRTERAERRPFTAEKRPGRNDPCHCGSGKKYKQCCLGKKSSA